MPVATAAQRHISSAAADAVRECSTFASSTHASVLFLVALSIPFLSFTALDVLTVFVVFDFARRRILRHSVVLRLLILALALGVYFYTSAGHGFVKDTIAAHSFVLLLGAYAAGFWAGRLRPGPSSLEGLSGLLAATAGAVAFAFFSVRQGLVDGGYEIFQRAAPSMWEPGVLINAPALGANLGLGMCLLPVALFAPTDARGRGRYTTLALAAMAAVAFYANIALQNRTPFVASAVALAGSALILVTSSKLRGRSKVLRIGIAVGAGILALMALPIFSQLTIYERFETYGLETERYDLWLKVLTEMWQNIDGGRAIRLTASYAHNLWLDVAWDAGPLPFVLLAAFHISHVRPAVFAFRSATPRARMILFGSGCALFATALAEPVMVLPLTYVVIHFYFLGILLGYAARPRSANLHLRPRGSNPLPFPVASN